MKSRFNRIRFALALFCAIGLICGQLFGMSRTFLCQCAGVTVMVANDHCHGPHGVQCDSAKSGCDHQDKHEDEQCPDRKNHEVVKETLKSRAAAAEPVSVPPPLVLAILPSLFAMQFEPQHIVPHFRSLPDTGPPPSIVTARTVVLLI